MAVLRMDMLDILNYINVDAYEHVSLMDCDDDGGLSPYFLIF
jgi:hypothetical protein